MPKEGLGDCWSLHSGFPSGMEIVVLTIVVLCYVNKSKNCMSDFTFVKVIFSRKTLVTLLICIFENYQVLSV